MSEGLPPSLPLSPFVRCSCVSLIKQRWTLLCQKQIFLFQSKPTSILQSVPGQLPKYPSSSPVMHANGSTWHQNPNPNLSHSSQPMLAFHFIRALNRINRQEKPSRTSPGAAIRRSHSIKRAAYASMALVAGPRRAWSRAVIRRFRGRSHGLGSARKKVVFRKRVRILRSKPRAWNQAGELRRLLPGGKNMDFCSLIEETGDYIQCLRAQVQVMETIANSMSSGLSPAVPEG